MKTIITKVENNRVTKFLDVSTENAEEILASVKQSYPDAFIYNGAYQPDLWVEDGEVSVIEILPSNDELKAKLQSELDAIEKAEIMPRKTREIQIQLMEFLAVQQGITPQQLALNPAYAGMKDVDAKCAEIRAQIRALS